MWKIALGFAVFAGLSLWMLSGADIDISGEKHGAASAVSAAST